MKKKITSVIIIVFTIMIFINNSFSSKAYEGGLDDKDKAILIEQINFVENNYMDTMSSQKQDLGLVAEYYIGDSVYMYEYTSDNQIKQCDFLCYPVFKNKQLSYFAITGEDGSSVQLTDCLVNMLSDYCENGKPIAIVERRALA